MFPTAILNTLLSLFVMMPAPHPTNVSLTTLTLAASTSGRPRTPAEVDDWAAYALAHPESDRGWNQDCNDDWGDGLDAYCVVRELPYAIDSKPIAFDGGQNSGMDLMGWDRPTIRVLYRVRGRARLAERARKIAESIDVTRSGGKVRPQGPAMTGRESWSVEFKVWVPRSSNLWMRTLNGPLGVSNVRGTMDLATTNGPLSLVDLAGAVQAHTDNGPLHVELEGTRWQGAGLDASTDNGPVHFALPENYSAHLETGTINGPSSIDYTLNLRNLGRGHLIATLGSGGPPVRVVTDNGPFHMESD